MGLVFINTFLIGVRKKDLLGVLDSKKATSGPIFLGSSNEETEPEIKVLDDGSILMLCGYKLIYNFDDEGIKDVIFDIPSDSSLAINLSDSNLLVDPVNVKARLYKAYQKEVLKREKQLVKLATDYAKNHKYGSHNLE